ncbi:malate dehydrogenase [Sulfobacillus thermosulfidooxidans]|nr:malate dehydrogenase [Sulfobacillus thermosulfidooxidans]OLZ13113.1 malate dehydrogenase [Sulfobacillus thermosulfidooxidans]OLZ21493.1 malate dehydrogenase [Sulfobacillus thermosulfidooxidans]
MPERMKTYVVQNGVQYIIRLNMQRDGLPFRDIVQLVDDLGGDIIAWDLVRAEDQKTIRDLTVLMGTAEKLQTLVEKLSLLEGVTVENVSDRTFLMHLGGKIEIRPRVHIKTRADLSHVYTPGVARVVEAIAEDPAKAFQLTMKRNTVAIVTDGSAILGLGNRGPKAALPVMEGKAVLFKWLADVDAIPICLDTNDVDEIVETVVRIAPAFGGINLEDIAAPRCFEIERRLSERLDIPVFHDDQHGTAVVILAGLINAAKVVGKSLESLRIVIAGMGAAGTATTELLLHMGVRDIIGYDRVGAIVAGKSYPGHPEWEQLAQKINPHRRQGSLKDLLSGADVFIGVSAANLLSPEDIQGMAPNAILFVMANPTPEIEPEIAQLYAKVVATGRSDYPNQINNVLCFPGFFRGVLDARAKRITVGMKVAAAYALASVVKDEELGPEYIIPSVFNREVSERIAKAVIQAAEKDNVARRSPKI